MKFCCVLFKDPVLCCLAVEVVKTVFVGSVGEALKSLVGFSGKPKTINRHVETYLEV